MRLVNSKWKVIIEATSGEFRQPKSNQTVGVDRMKKGREEEEKWGMGARNFVCQKLLFIFDDY